MFDSIINRAQHSVESAVLRYVMRVAVAVPFIIAFGFGIAAASTKLVQLYGQSSAYAMIAGSFAGLGLILVGILAFVKPSASASEDYAAAPETVASTGSTAGASAIDSDLLVATLGIAGPKIIPAIPFLLRFVVRNWSLVLAGILITYMLFAERERVSSEAGQRPVS
jgi:hypothetical protein